MKRQRSIAQTTILVLCLITAGSISFAVSADTLASEIPPHVLLVDETQTFAATLRVGAVAGALRQAGTELEVRLETVSSSYVDPLVGLEVLDDPFDLVLIVPVGIEDGSVPEIWLLCGSSITASDNALLRVELLHGLSQAAFAGLASPVGISDDLWLAGLAAEYEVRGWLR